MAGAVQLVQCRYKNIATWGPFAIEHMVSITYNSFKARQCCSIIIFLYTLGSKDPEG